jgi:hypothetical protein
MYMISKALIQLQAAKTFKYIHIMDKYIYIKLIHFIYMADV